MNNFKKLIIIKSSMINLIDLLKEDDKILIDKRKVIYELEKINKVID